MSSLCSARHRLSLAGLLLCLLGGFFTARVQAQTYSLTDIKQAGGNEFYESESYCLGQDGTIGGLTGSGVYYGYLWRGGRVQLPNLPNLTGFSYAYGVSKNGTTVGSCADSSAVTPYAAIWKGGPPSTPTALQGSQSEALAINDSDLIVGYYYSPTTSNCQAFSYDTALHPLPDLPNTSEFHTSKADAVNNVGEIAGQSDYNTPDNPHAVLWKDGQVYDLGTLGGATSVAYGINDAGQIVGQADTGKTDQYGNPLHHAFLWTPTAVNGTSGKMQDLGALSGGLNSLATDINNCRQVVGSSDCAADEAHSYNGSSAFLWDSTHKMRDLLTLTGRVNLEIPAFAWYFRNAVAINDSGQIAADITEEYTDGNNSAEAYHGCLLSPDHVWAAPGAPTSLAAAQTAGPVSIKNGAELTLTWQLTDTLGTSVLVERKTGSGAFAQITSLPVGSTFYNDTGLPYSTAYSYRVRTVDANGYSPYSNTATATTAATPAVPTALSFSPSTVSSNGMSTATVTLSKAAPTGGLTVAFTENGADAGTGTVPAGQTSTKITYYAAAVTASTNYTVAVSANGGSASATLTVKPTTVKLAGLSFNPNPVKGGGSTTGTVTLSAPAPTGGAVVTITNNGTVLYQMTIPAGQASATYAQPTGAVTAQTSYPFQAAYNNSTASATLVVNP